MEEFLGLLVEVQKVQTTETKEGLNFFVNIVQAVSNALESNKKEIEQGELERSNTLELNKKEIEQGELDSEMSEEKTDEEDGFFDDSSDNELLTKWHRIKREVKCDSKCDFKFDSKSGFNFDNVENAIPTEVSSGRISPEVSKTKAVNVLKHIRRSQSPEPWDNKSHETTTDIQYGENSINTIIGTLRKRKAEREHKKETDKNNIEENIKENIRENIEENVRENVEKVVIITDEQKDKLRKIIVDICGHHMGIYLKCVDIISLRDTPFKGITLDQTKALFEFFCPKMNPGEVSRVSQIISLVKF